MFTYPLAREVSELKTRVHDELDSLEMVIQPLCDQAESTERLAQENSVIIRAVSKRFDSALKKLLERVAAIESKLKS